MLAKTKNNDTVATPLARKAVLVVFSISVWTARKLDRQVTRETNERYHANEQAGRFNKLVIDAKSLDNLAKLAGQGRAVVYKYTKPWAEEGPRVLPNVNYEKMTNELRPIIREFETEADKFERRYPDYIEDARAMLNGMWKASDYPAASHIRAKFNMQIKYLPFPDAQDFRADIDEDTFADLKSEIEKSSSGEMVLRSTAEQVVEVVGHMAKKLAEYRGSDYVRKEGEKRSFFADTLVENVRELADLLPAFNLTDDAKFTKVIDRINKELCVEEPDVLRDNKNVRASVQQSAEEIVADVKKLFG